MQIVRSTKKRFWQFEAFSFLFFFSYVLTEKIEGNATCMRSSASGTVCRESLSLLKQHSFVPEIINYRD